MANEKMITRTIIVGYNYDVLRKEGKIMTIVGTVTVPKPIRSLKEQKVVLTANKYLESDSIVQTDTITKQFAMGEADFMKNAIVVTDVTENTESQEQKDEQPQEQ